jgi:shikimate kinase
MLNDVSKRRNLIVSTGGGVILSSENISTMQNTGSIIHLDISIKIQLLRVRNKKNRPLLDVDNIKEKLTEMKNLRDNTYKSISNYSILTDNKNKKDIVQEIIDKLND